MIAVAKWGVTRKFFLATCNATFVALRCKVQEKLLRVTWPLEADLRAAVSVQVHSYFPGLSRQVITYKFVDFSQRVK